jgi:hypothetical protein
MAERIGNVLYWIGCGAAVIMVLLGIAGYISDTSTSAIFILVFCFVCALVSWLIGRALLYVLAAR